MPKRTIPSLPVCAAVLLATAALLLPLGGCASGRGRVTAAVPLTIFSSEAGDVYIDGEQVASLEAGESHQQNILIDTYRIEVQFASGDSQRERVFVGQAMEVRFGKPVGTIEVTSQASGQVYLGGSRVAEITGGGSVTLENVDLGRRVVEVRYFDGARERNTVTVQDMESVTVRFSYEEGAYRVGDRGPAGGIVFYDKGDDDEGWRYLEAWTEDESGTYQWKTSPTSTPGTSTAIGSGYQNTYTAMSSTQHPAAQVARNASHGGFNDWFLPSIYELNLMYQQRGVIGGFASDVYWSSSVPNSVNAWHQHFAHGAQYDSNRTLNGRVRVVRTFIH